MAAERLKRRDPSPTVLRRQLHDAMPSGTLEPGDRLGRQQESFGAGIASVREAVSVLSARGLLDARPGRGTHVRRRRRVGRARRRRTAAAPVEA